MPITVVALALTLGAASPSEPYRAVGRDEAWSLEISGGNIRLERPGHPTLTVAKPPIDESEDGFSYQSRRITVSAIQHPCRHPGTGQRWTDSVFVEIGGREHVGCGGEIIPADSLDYTSWHFTEIDGRATELTGDLLRDDRYAVDFSADGLVGYGGCNRFSASYTRDGDVLTPTLRGATRRACSAPVMALEARLFEILSQPLRISFPDAQSLLLTGETGSIRLRRSEGDF